METNKQEELTDVSTGIPFLDNEMEKHFERVLDCIFDKSPGWEKRLRGFFSQGMGDLIYRTAIYAMILQDWDLLLNCLGLLRCYKRWPDWVEIGKKKRREFRRAGYRRHRGQRSMTRDPYFVTLAAAALFEEGNTIDLVKKMKIPFWMNRPMLWAYKKSLEDPLSERKRKRLECILLFQMKWREGQQTRRLVWQSKKADMKQKDNRLGEYIYGALTKILGYPMYVKFIHSLVAYTARLKKVQAELSRQTPHWNYAILLLCEKPTMYLAKDFIENYKAHEGFQWSGGTLLKADERLIPEEEELKMDKDFLDFIWERYQTKSNRRVSHSFPLTNEETH